MHERHLMKTPARSLVTPDTDIRTIAKGSRPMASHMAHRTRQAAARERISALLEDLAASGADDIPTLQTDRDPVVQMTYLLETVEQCLRTLADRTPTATKPSAA